jgi:hypothetical protein
MNAGSASSDGVRSGQLGAIGLLTPAGEPLHEQAVRDEHNRASVRMVRGWHSSGSNELWDGLNQRDRGEDGNGRWASAQGCSLFRAGVAPDMILGAPVSWLLELNRGLNHGRQATHRTDDNGSPIVGKQSLNAADWIRADLLAAEGWNVERLKRDQPAHRPAERIKDRAGILELAFDVKELLATKLAFDPREALENGFKNVSDPRTVIGALEFWLSSIEIETFAGLMAEHGKRGHSTRTMYKLLARCRRYLDTSEPVAVNSSKGGRTCFRCAGPDGKPRRSAGQTNAFYDVGLADAARTIHLCDACYVSPAERSARKKALERSRAPSPEKRYTRPPEEGSAVHEVVTQNTMILARIERMEAQLAQTLARCAEATDRLRDRFPTDAEVSAAVETFLGVAVAEDESEAA